MLSRDPLKVLFIRPPSHLWPIINESDNFLMPLSFPSLSAYLKREMPGIVVKIIDCLPLQIGFKSLEQLMRWENPDVVGVGDSLPYVEEGMRVLRLAKAINPSVVTVAGGHFHSHMPEYSLGNYAQLDYIVRYEGERALVDLLQALQQGTDLSAVRSIAFRKDGKVVETPPGPLIEDLDSLPMPDYDAMPVHKYSPFGKLWPRAATVQASRGCPLDCKFCSWSALESEHRLENGRVKLIPRMRRKSVSHVMEEIDVLYNKFGIRYLFWVDGTWNFSTQWVDELASEILRKGYKLGWWAFLRADLLLEQERQGVLEKVVRAGLSHTLFGGERPEKDEMKSIGKTALDGGELMAASHLLARKYPSVFRQATFVTGIRTETRESMERLGKYARDSLLDFAAFHPIQPYPGTPLWEQANREGWIEDRDFSHYDMFHPIMSSESLSRDEIAHLTRKLYMDFVGKRPTAYLKGMVSSVPIRRRLHRWFLFSIGRVILKDLYLSVKGDKQFEGFAATNKLWKPRWYET
jgi:anaerobic magnesium-protoporphyrin IX monomethyl ester cyclase